MGKGGGAGAAAREAEPDGGFAELGRFGVRLGGGQRRGRREIDWRVVDRGGATGHADADRDQQEKTQYNHRNRGPTSQTAYP
jgi:hypothetical protein